MKAKTIKTASRALALFATLGLAALVGVACDSDDSGLGNGSGTGTGSGGGGGGSGGSGNIICTGDPDTGIVCRPADQIWDCQKLPNAEVKCVNQDPGTPGGGSTWTCREEGGKLICTTPDKGVDGGGGWTCKDSEIGTTCEKPAPAPPSGGGSYKCGYDSEFKYTCTGDTEPPPPPPPTNPPGPPPTGGGQRICYVAAPDNPTDKKPLSGAWAEMRTAKVMYNGVPALYVRFKLDKGYVDNTYGDYAVDYLGGPSHTRVGGGHSFGDLVESDKLEIFVNNSKGDLLQHFAVDYISPDGKAKSGYASLGVTGGEGAMMKGSASDILGAQTSLAYNFNVLGYVLTKNSPATDVNYKADPKYPNWIFDVWYEVWIKWSAYGANGPGRVYITGLHASPNKTGIKKFDLVPGPCP